MDMSFYSSQNYTSHNISANGEVADVTYQLPSGVTSLAGRWAYETQTAAGDTIYEAIGDADTYAYMQAVTSTTVKTPIMNNLGLSGLAKKDPTPVVYQVKPVSTKRLIMPDDPGKPGVRQRFNPSKDADRWYTVWRGTMYPPNYVLVVGTNGEVKDYLSRGNIKDGASDTYANMAAAVKEYWEVDPDHPKFGKGKWALSDLQRMFTDDTSIFCELTFEIQGYIYHAASPGNNEVYGDPFIKNAYWSDGNNGWINGAYYYWIFLGGSDTNKFPSWWWAQTQASATKRWDYPMTSVSMGNGGVKGRGWLKCE